MKINFDELFSMTKSPSTDNFKKNSYQSQASTTPGIPLKVSQLQSSVVESQPFQLTDSKLSKKIDGDIKRILQNNRQQGNNYKWYKTAKFQGEAQNVDDKKKKKQKVMTKKQIQQMTDRLSRRPQRFNKKQLSKKFQEELLNYRSPKANKKIVTQGNQSNRNKPKRYERLYHQYKTRQFKAYELQIHNSKEQKQNNKRIKYKNQTYQKKYIPYFSRYDKQLDKRRRRELFYQKNIIVNQQILNFSPNITNSMRTLEYLNKTSSITPKKQKNQILGHGQMKMRKLGSSVETSFNNSLQKSLNKSLQNVLNRSLEIVQKKQHALIDKIVQLFESNGYFQIKPESVQKLDQMEFQAFFPLIASMQKHGKVSIKQFQQQLLQYFQALPSFYKFNLRTSQRQKQKQKKLNMKFIQRITFKDEQIIKSSRIKMKNDQAAQKNDYLLKLQNYI